MRSWRCPAQTQLQEELPSEVRGRVFGVLNMLVSLASFLPIVIVGPVADVIGAPAVIVISAVIVAFTGLASILWSHPAPVAMASRLRMQPVDPIAVATNSASLTRAVRLRAHDPGNGNAMGPIQLLDDESRALVQPLDAATEETPFGPRGPND